MPALELEQLYRDYFEYLDIEYPDTQTIIAPFPDPKPGVPHPQRMAIESEADELFYGGAAGGGKTFLLLILALRYHKNSVIYRRQKDEIEDLYLESRDILLDTPAVYNQNKHVWSDIPGDRRLEFGGVQYEKDVVKLQGRARDLKGFDEITNFTKSIYTYLTIWTRTKRKGQRTRVVVTGNPPTNSEGMWVIDHWAAWLNEDHPNPAKPGELRWYVTDQDDNEIELLSGDMYTLPDGTRIKPRSRTFIPANIDDNPLLKETEYKSSLDSLPKFLRDRFRDGKFTSKADDPEDQCIPTELFMEAQLRWRKPDPDMGFIAAGLDIARGGKDNTVLARLAFDGYLYTIAPLIVVPGVNTPTGRITVKAMQDYIDEQMKLYIDANTWGADAFERFKDGGYKVEGVNVGRSSSEWDAPHKHKFANLRAQLYWRLREWLMPDSKIKLAMPPDRQLLIELCAVKFKYIGGKIKLEEKAETASRLGYSPDRADAVVLALKHIGKRARASKFDWKRSFG